MSTAKWTPGPRLLAPTEVADMLPQLKGDACLVFPSVEQACAYMNRNDAATRMAEALRHVIMEWRLHGSLTDSCRVAEAALAKAEGREP